MSDITKERLADGLILYQHADKFCFGTDSVLLAWFSCLKKAKRGVDLCSGTGIVPTLQVASMKSFSAVAVEIDEEAAELCRRSVSENGLSERIEVLCEDVNHIKQVLPHAVCDLVTVNPPYLDGSAGFAPAYAAEARQELSCTFDGIAAAAAYLLKEKGRFCAVMRADRTVDVLCAMREHGIEPKRLLPVMSTPSKEPYVILCEGIKGGKRGMTLSKPLVLCDEKGEPSEAVKEIYRFGLWTEGKEKERTR